MSEPITMSSEREAYLRDIPHLAEVYAELDATRDIVTVRDGQIEVISRERDDLRSQLQTEREAHKRTQEALDRLLQPLRTIEALLGTLDHSGAVEEIDLAATVEHKTIAAIQQLRHSQEVSKALLESLKRLLKVPTLQYYAPEDVEFIANAIALAERPDALRPAEVT